jgi:hypothetical protein
MPFSGWNQKLRLLDLVIKMSNNEVRFSELATAGKQTQDSFNENCRAANSIKDWVDCLSPNQAPFCGFSSQFGNGYFCIHPHKYQIVEFTKKIKNESGDTPK